LGNELGQQYINVNELSSLLETTEDTIKLFSNGATRPAKEIVQIRRFDNIVKEMPFDIYSKKNFLKMDTQGYDLKVLSGVQSIRKNIVAIQAESLLEAVYDKAPQWTESIKEYTEAGFKFAGLYPVVREGIYYRSSDCIIVRRTAER
jgi:hypothetical protein